MKRIVHADLSVMRGFPVLILLWVFVTSILVWWLTPAGSPWIGYWGNVIGGWLVFWGVVTAIRWADEERARREEQRERQEQQWEEEKERRRIPQKLLIVGNVSDEVKGHVMDIGKLSQSIADIDFVLSQVTGKEYEVRIPATFEDHLFYIRDGDVPKWIESDALIRYRDEIPMYIRNELAKVDGEAFGIYREFQVRIDMAGSIFRTLREKLSFLKQTLADNPYDALTDEFRQEVRELQKECVIEEQKYIRDLDTAYRQLDQRLDAYFEELVGKLEG